MNKNKFILTISISSLLISVYYFKKSFDVHKEIYKAGCVSKVRLTRNDLIKSFSKYDAALLSKLEWMSANKVEYNNKELISIVEDLIDLPADRNFLKIAKAVKLSPQGTIIDAHLKQKKNGFFVEVGGFDGEELSNTLFFEAKRNWIGLLIEADPYFYMQLVGKNRRSFSINACLSDDAFVHIKAFQESVGSHGKMISGQTAAGQNTLMIPCFSLQTLLLAINVSKIDYFSLDVEGFEMPILKTILPDKNFQIDILSVEYIHGDKNDIRKYMEQHNYTVIKDVSVYKAELGIHADDFIAVKNPK